MSETQKPPTWFWVVVALALLWNLMGLMAFFMQAMMTPEFISAMPEAERMLYQGMPVWAYIAFAVAVFCGTLGCIALAMRKSWAVPLFKLSLAGVIVQNFSAFFVQDSFAVFGSAGAIMVATVVGVAIALLWFSLRARNNNWIA